MVCKMVIHVVEKTKQARERGSIGEVAFLHRIYQERLIEKGI